MSRSASAEVVSWAPGGIRAKDDAGSAPVRASDYGLAPTVVTIVVLLACMALSMAAIHYLPPIRSSIAVVVVAAVCAALTWKANVLPTLILLPTSLYTVGPLYGASLGDRLWPFPPLGVYVSSALLMITTLYAALAVCVGLGLGHNLRAQVRRSAESIARLSMVPPVRWLATGTVLVLAVQAWIIVAQNGFLTAGRSRRGVEMLFWAAANLTGQMIAVVASVLLAASMLQTKAGARLLTVGLLAGLWIPFLSGGGRRILLYAAIPAMVVLFSCGSRLIRTLVLVGGVAGLAWFVVVPMAFPGGGEFADKGHGEWSMAGAPFVALYTGALSNSDVQAVGWPENWIRALPDFLGGSSAAVLADQVSRQTSLFPTGTSGSPWSDAWTGDATTTGLMLASILVVALALSRSLDRLAPGTLVIALGSIAMFGRTHAPYMLTTIVTPFLLIAALTMIERFSRPTVIENTARQ